MKGGIVTREMEFVILNEFDPTVCLLGGYVPGFKRAPVSVVANFAKSRSLPQSDHIRQMPCMGVVKTLQPQGGG